MERNNLPEDMAPGELFFPRFTSWHMDRNTRLLSPPAVPFSPLPFSTILSDIHNLTGGTKEPFQYSPFFFQ